MTRTQQIASLALIAGLSPLAGLLPASAQSENVPKINYEASCRASERATGGAMETIEACTNSERAARDTLANQWTSFAAADRASCYSLTTTGTPGTYTELLTCLEMRQQVRALPNGSSGTVGLGATR